MSFAEALGARSGLAASMLFAVCGASRSAKAGDAPTAGGALAPAPEVAMSYSGTAGCPTEATFVAGLRRLTPHLKVLPKARTAARLTIAFEQRDGAFLGRLTYGETNREVSAAACADAAYALAVVAAITLDPDATVEQSGVEAKDFAEPTPSPPASTEVSPPVVVKAKPAAPKAKPVVYPTPAPAPSRARPSRWTAWLGPRAAWGEVGTWSWGGDLSLMNTSDAALATYSLAVRGATARRDLDVTTLTFMRLGVGVEWCPRLGAGDVWQLYGCGGAEVGYAKVDTRETSEFADSDLPGSTSLIGTLEVVWAFALDDNWRLGFTPGLMVPIISNEYVLESGPGVTVMSVRHRRVVGTVGLQVGYGFD